RPAALAGLMVVVVDRGVRRARCLVSRLTFAAQTPYHTVFDPAPATAERVMRAEVARSIRRVLADVVSEGTAQRVKGAFLGPGGEPVVTGGKTGSGDNRSVLVARGGEKIGSRAMSRTAAFVFYIGD